MRHLRASALVAVLLPWLAGCFAVIDFGEYWDKGILDPMLKGTWEDHMSKRNTTLIKEGDHYRYASITDPKKISADDPTKIKTLKAGSATYLMLNGPLAKALVRYAATDDRVVIYEPDYKKFPQFKQNYGSMRNLDITAKGITIRLLDEKVLNILGTLGKREEYWKESMVLNKLKPGQKTYKEQNVDIPDPFKDLEQKGDGASKKAISKPEDATPQDTGKTPDAKPAEKKPVTKAKSKAKPKSAPEPKDDSDADDTGSKDADTKDAKEN